MFRKREWYADQKTVITVVPWTLNMGYVLISRGGTGWERIWRRHGRQRKGRVLPTPHRASWLCLFPLLHRGNSFSAPVLYPDSLAYVNLPGPAWNQCIHPSLCWNMTAHVIGYLPALTYAHFYRKNITEAFSLFFFLYRIIRWPNTAVSSSTASQGEGLVAQKGNMFYSLHETYIVNVYSSEALYCIIQLVLSKLLDVHVLELLSTR